jgi:hypothetical protein
MAKYIRELLDPPSKVNKGEFGLKLAAGTGSISASGAQIRGQDHNARLC